MFANEEQSVAFKTFCEINKKRYVSFVNTYNALIYK